MQTTTHALAAPRRGRYLALFVALLLQAGFVWVLVSGLTLKDVIRFVDPIKVDITPTVRAKPLPPTVPDHLPPPVYMPIPDLPPIDAGPRDTAPTFTGNQPQPPAVANSGPFGIAATHTTPPYPPIEQRLGHQGTVVLRLTISAQGTVTDAAVVRSCGYERLDEVARAWVLAHWRYRPAVRGGVAVPATGDVAVTFDLRNAG
jgi:protein TonB